MKENKEISNRLNEQATRYPKRAKAQPDYFESEVNTASRGQVTDIQARVRAPPSPKSSLDNDGNCESLAINDKVIESEGSVSNKAREPDEHSQEDQESTYGRNQNFKRFKEVGEQIQYRTDSLVGFVKSDGTPYDENCKNIIKFKNITDSLEASVGEVKEMKTKKGQLFYFLCISDNNLDSITSFKEAMTNTLVVLRERLLATERTAFSVGQTEIIGDLSWCEVINILDRVFEETNIEIVICTGSSTYVPRDKQDEVFQEYHKSPIGGHRGVSKTYRRIKQNYYWENLRRDVQRRIQQCLECQLKKLKRVKTKLPMVITDTPGVAFDKIAMDIVGPMRKTKNGKEYILTLQCQLTKFCLAFPLEDTLATTVADVLIKRFITIFSAPRVILTDQGSNFLSKMMQRVAKRFRIKQVNTTAFHPQSNGSLERSHHPLGEFLKQYTDMDNEWDEWVELAIFNYNTSVHESTGLTPYEVVFGKLARLPTMETLREGDMQPTYKDYMVKLVSRINALEKLAYENLVRTKEKCKKYYDKVLNKERFKVGDYVFLTVGPKPGKFGDHYSGPHKILEVIGHVNFRISFKKGNKIVHRNRLRKSTLNQEFAFPKRLRKKDPAKLP